MEDGEVKPESPFFFLKPPSALAAGGGSIAYPPDTALLHHEVELVVALGRAGSNLDPEAAKELVFGYAVGLDLTRRDRQAEAKQRGRPWGLAKGFDGSAPCSAIVPAERIGSCAVGRISAWVNGVLRQDGDLDQQIWDVPNVISQLSTQLRLLPGDLLFTGTPAGVGELRPGDHIVAEIDGLPRLEVDIVRARD
jgi:fumarylpyruvate hydrolase